MIKGFQQKRNKCKGADLRHPLFIHNEFFISNNKKYSHLRNHALKVHSYPKKLFYIGPQLIKASLSCPIIGNY